MAFKDFFLGFLFTFMLVVIVPVLESDLALVAPVKGLTLTDVSTLHNRGPFL